MLEQTVGGECRATRMVRYQYLFRILYNIV